MKNDGHLGRCYLKGRDGDAANAILTAVGLQLPLAPRMVENYFARSSEPEASIHGRSSADFITNMFGFRFSVHTAFEDQADSHVAVIAAKALSVTDVLSITDVAMRMKAPLHAVAWVINQS